MNMNPQLFPVPFHQDTIVLVEHNDQPYIAMKPLVENLGLAWAAQYTKLTASPRWGVTIIGIPSLGGTQEAVCIPLQKIGGWLYSISPNKVAAALREKIVQYQEECDDALWRYWTQGSVTRTGGKQGESRAKQINTAIRIIHAKNRTPDLHTRKLLDTMLAETAASLGFSYQPDLLDGTHP